ncbi:MAG TPA: Nif3-like dinuclear metal center hexameric protein [Chitinophagaceae bacterium]|nr:Nif3-like dinuclear metal center hexameric protein [Chitinophagaceae bacterium]
MKIREIIAAVEVFAAPELQEEWDNTGLLTGSLSWDCTGVLCALDVTLDVLIEARAKNCNLIVAHHPIVFKGLKQFTGKTYVERLLIEALKWDIAIYAAHTSLDNVVLGVNGKIAEKLELKNCRMLAPMLKPLRRLITFAPHDNAEAVRQAVFAAGAGHIGKYSECSFNSKGTGTFKAEAGADPYVGEIGKQHQEEETKIEIVFPAYLELQVVKALVTAHPYEEVAYDIFTMENRHQGMGAGIIGELETPVPEHEFLKTLQTIFKTPCVRHTALLQKPVQTVAVCGGSGAFLLKQAAQQGAHIYITADVKYHEFFDAEDQLVLADIGHYESEQFTIDLLQELIAKKFPTFAILKTTVVTNPVHYLV